MTIKHTRAAVNILGSDGSLIDITSMGKENVSTSKVGKGVYQILGSFGMVPIPEGWGYVLNSADSDKKISISYEASVLKVEVTKDGEYADLDHSITLHILVEANTDEVVPPTKPPQADPLEVATALQTQLRKDADYAIAPLQDAMDIDEASAEDEALLKEWKRYRVALSKVQNQVGWPIDVIWPEKPVKG